MISELQRMARGAEGMPLALFGLLVTAAILYMVGCVLVQAFRDRRRP